jgi:hypothetical protein
LQKDNNSPSIAAVHPALCLTKGETIMNKTHLRTYANHIRSALINRREALKLELAVMFAVTLEAEGNKRLAREAIYQVYNSTGSYQCSQPSDRDWKSVGRQITAGLALYDFINHDDPDTVASWANGHKHGELIGALVEQIAPYKLSTVNEILTVCEKVSRPRAPRGVPAGAHEIRTEHCHLVIPPSVKADEVMTIINNLMAYANTLLDAQREPERKAA